MNQYKLLLKDTLIIGFSNIFSKGVFFLVIPLQTFSMSKSEYGLAEFIFSLMNIFIPLFTLGLSEAGMRFAISDEEKRKEILSVITIIPIVGSALIIVLYYLYSSFIPFINIYFREIILLYLFFALKDIYLQFSKGINDLKDFACGSILFSIILLFSSYYFLVIQKLAVYGYLYAYIIANAFVVIYLLLFSKLKVYLKNIHKNFDVFILRTMVIYGLPLSCNILAWWITNLSNRYILAYYYDFEIVGIYSVLAKFSMILPTGFAILFQSWQLSAAKNICCKDRQKFFSNIWNCYVILLIFISVVFMIFSRNIADLLVLGNFNEVYQYLAGMVFVGTISCLPMYWGAIYGALKNTKGAFYSTVSGSIASMAFNFLLIPEYGIYGAVISSVISYCVVMVYRIIDINKIILIDLNTIKHLIGFLCLLIQVYVYTFSTNNIFLGNVVLMIILLAVYYKNFIGLFYIAKKLK